jgi:glycosyltransferase involved in cell wall biosynthesis
MNHISYLISHISYLISHISYLISHILCVNHVKCFIYHTWLFRDCFMFGLLYNNIALLLLYDYKMMAPLCDYVSLLCDDITFVNNIYPFIAKYIYSIKVMTTIVDDSIYICNEFFGDAPITTNDIIKKTLFDGKIYLIVTYWTYPFGGGEEFMFDTMEWANKLGMQSYWIAFADSKNRSFTEFKITKHQYGIIINIPDGLDIQTLTNWLYIINPDVVHHQGLHRQKIYYATEELRIEFLTGYHFWTGGILIDDEKKNMNIIENATHHKIDPEFELLLKKDKCNFYCASIFVQECFEAITHVHIDDCIYPASSNKRYLVDNYNPWNSKYVTMINIHKHKGGNILYQLLKKCPDIHFLCVRTEHDSDELDKMIYDEMEKRNNECKNDKNIADCLFLNRTNDVKSIYSKTKIMLCTSLVDETFCRVVNESMLNGIPVFSTHRGNIKYLLGDTSPILDVNNIDQWESAIKSIYYDEDKYLTMSNNMRNKYRDSSEDLSKVQFKNVMEKILLKSKIMNIGIFTPWCDQGLGIQSRNYYNILKTYSQYNVFIFALKPYNADSCIKLQKNPNEWIVDNVYYSPNVRETVTDKEMIDFCEKYNIGKMIMPETCWDRIFQIAKLLREIGVKAYAIPNIEIVRRDEVYKHNHFYKILANNYLCKRIFGKVDVPCEYIGYGVKGLEYKEKQYTEEQTIRYLFIGGMNAFSRKNVLKVCEGFSKACEMIDNIELTVTIQMTNLLEETLKEQIKKYKNHPKIKIFENHFTYTDLMNMYYSHHISIQVSKHEGLGLGFYEAVATGTPVLSLKTPPHDEIILDNVNGWIINAKQIKMLDNKDPLFGSADFDPIDLSNKMIEISNNDTVSEVISSLKTDLETRLSLETFSNRFLNELN